MPGEFKNQHDHANAEASCPYTRGRCSGIPAPTHTGAAGGIQPHGELEMFPLSIFKRNIKCSQLTIQSRELTAEVDPERSVTAGASFRRGPKGALGIS